MPASDSEDPPSFTLAYVPGVTPDKWVRTWGERVPEVSLTLLRVSAAEAGDRVRARDTDAVLLRLPTDRTGLHAIPLYTETTVVVTPKDHVVTAVDEVSVTDLADEVLLHPLDDTLDWDRPPGLPAIERPATTAAAIELVAAGAGLLVVPLSLARLHHRRNLTYRPVTDAPSSRVALAWREDETTDLMEQFIGIVRGRTVNSTRGRPPAAAPAKRTPRADEDRKGAARGATRRTRNQASGAPRKRTRRKPRRRS
ncbi:LysR family substrate-binding domain-containing protein [Saccharomonospora saliphila]|uniref:LysR family substrate-binding domain-containing protein n=1 Tax=Saccharomonospora saliphila TaxID=369829 RepID=UPI00035D1F70|nr:LysR family substrate-binding domain-containing protein [Saccharomonospora saliphila]